MGRRAPMARAARAVRPRTGTDTQRKRRTTTKTTRRTRRRMMKMTKRITTGTMTWVSSAWLRSWPHWIYSNTSRCYDRRASRWTTRGDTRTSSSASWACPWACA
eukprot:Mycagemm_TRINITY_DN9499_c0_g1::TRINITY_DN9499_c0_g1_i1::g.3081::m.3081 type:complete len:104 gc:universal TRINITY_DN9499_c0_g1_i1:801-1112(+)